MATKKLTLGAAIKARRLELQMSQSRLAERTISDEGNATQDMISKIERCEYQNPPAHILRSIADALGLSFTELSALDRGKLVVPRKRRPRPRKTLGELIRAGRMSRSMSQKQLAQGAGLLTSYVSEIERGANRYDIPPYAKQKLAAALGLDQELVMRAKVETRP